MSDPRPPRHQPAGVTYLGDTVEHRPGDARADTECVIPEVPAPLPGRAEQVRRWAEVVTGMELDGDGAVHVLDAATWGQRRLRLEELGGPPGIKTPWD